jgi:hypothetical protein
MRVDTPTPFFGAAAYQSMNESALQQRYRDGWAKTVVVRKTVFTPTPKHPAWRLVLAIAAGSAAAVAIQFTEMLLNVL